MNIKSNERKEHSAIELVIEVGAAEFQSAIDTVYKRQKNRISLPGFRKGKAPRKMVEKMYGADIFYDDAISLAYPDAYEAALKETGIDPVSYPQLEVLEANENGFTFKATVTVKPECSIEGYKDLNVDKPSVEVTEEDIQDELKPYVDRASRLVSVEREAQMGDTAVIDFEGFKDGVAFEGGKAENFSLELGSGSFVPGFEDQVVGMKPGEEKDLDITFPENYTPELAGAAVVFKVKVHEVKEKQEPELDDEFAKDVSEFETLDEFKKDLGDKLKVRLEKQADSDFENAVMDQLIEKLNCDVPEPMIEYRADKFLENYVNRIQSQGISFEDYLRMVGLTMEEMRAQSKAAASRSVHSDLALEAVAVAEGLEITDEEVDAEFTRMAYKYEVPVDQVRDVIKIEDVRHDLLNRKALDFVKAAVSQEPSAGE